MDALASGSLSGRDERACRKNDSTPSSNYTRHHITSHHITSHHITSYPISQHIIHHIKSHMSHLTYHNTYQGIHEGDGVMDIVAYRIDVGQLL